MRNRSLSVSISCALGCDELQSDTVGTCFLKLRVRHGVVVWVGAGVLWRWGDCGKRFGLCGSPR